MPEYKTLEVLTQFLSNKMIVDPVIGQIQSIIDEMVDQEKLRQDLRQWANNYNNYSKRASQETQTIQHELETVSNRLKEETRHIDERIKGSVKQAEENLARELKQFNDQNLNKFKKFKQDFESEFVKIEQKFNTESKRLEQSIGSILGQQERNFKRDIETLQREQKNIHEKLTQEIEQSKVHIDRTLTYQEDRFSKEFEQFKKNISDVQNEMRKSLHTMQQQWNTDKTESVTRLQIMKQEVESHLKELKQQMGLFEQSKEDFLRRIDAQMKTQQETFHQIEKQYADLLLQQKCFVELKEEETAKNQGILTNTVWLNRCTYVLAFIPTLPRSLSIPDLRHIFGGVSLDGLIKTPFSPPSEALIQVKKYQFENYLPESEQHVIADLCNAIFRQYHVEISPSIRLFLQKYTTK